ncbi:unnamed protein product, partial [marine sediment metagenome]
MKQRVVQLIEETIKLLQKQKELPRFEIPEISVEYPEKEIHGDYSTNIAMNLAGKLKKKPIEIAKIITQSLDQSLFDKVEIVEPGFINFSIKKQYLQEQIVEILDKGEK